MTSQVAALLVLLPTTDSDGDGMPDWQEFIAGTDPYNANSMLSVYLVNGGSDGALIQFTAMPNIGYTIQYCTDLTTGSWLTLTNVPPGAGGGVVITDPWGSLRRFYRIVTP